MEYFSGHTPNILSIPNYIPSRQGKSLDFKVATFLIKLCKNMKKAK